MYNRTKNNIALTWHVAVMVFDLNIMSIYARNSSVGIAARYGLDGPGDRIPLGARFSAPVQTGPESHPASYAMGNERVSFQGIKRPGHGVDHPPHLALRLKKE